ncbi:CDP-glycerol glycerophosphotransferase family protein [Aeromicrobium sp.]|uniref:CDP-glycerol glycerophosphotransferase family protein n=1 Tax=Aeromicrobium sp. TaxID=1871063 RepID=UPI00199D2F63|nr:CDP-glycerol glycerophosphotransferase family protein [Aeromicrobium sp.]MBC7630246.1 CDP-glycerol glycerophosphotransferase family protein [Aeromicrobium sp.]
MQITGDLTIAAVTPGDVAGSVTRQLDLTTTRYVTFTDDGVDEPGLSKFLAHARRTAELCDLVDPAVPLLVLSGPHDHAVVVAYRTWLAGREAVTDVDAYLALLPFRSIGASLHGVDVVDGGDTVRLTGTCRRDGVEGQVRPDDVIDLRVIDRAGAVRLSVHTEPRLRYEDSSVRWTGFTADLPVDQLPTGTLRLELDAPVPGNHVVRRPLACADGALASSRPVTMSGKRLQLVPARGTEEAELVVATSSRLRWGLSMALRDLRVMHRRRSFWWVRSARLLTRPVYGCRRGPIWLVGERSDTARDNGFHLFSHLRREHPDIRAYYVIDKDSDQLERVSGLGRVVAHSSWRHRLLMLHAVVLANAYSIKHMAPRQWDASAYMRQFAWRVGSHRVYLKHGINLNTLALRRRIGGYDLYLTASEAETVAARATSGYDQQVALTGLPRYDALVPTPRSRTIMFMPTWRMYLTAGLFSNETAKVPFEGSLYQRFMLDFVSSQRLAHMLERHDHRLQLMPHYNLREHLGGLDTGSDRITVLNGAAADIQDLMRECDLFVTDHSSVHFDLAYLGTPVVYSHFDAEDYRRGHADSSWFDHERDGFGPVTYDLDSTLDAVEHYLANGCEREPEYDRRAQQAFAFHDRDNSRRAVAAIEALLRF